MRLKGFAHLVIVFVIIFVATSIALVIFFVHSKSKENSYPSTTSQSKSEAARNTTPDDFFNFSIPKPLEDLTVLDLPNSQSLSSVAQIADSLWVAGDGTLNEYDAKTNKLISYSNYKKANCSRDVVAVNDYIYVSCNVNNIDGFGKENNGTVYTGESEIFKINPRTHKIEKRFSGKDGLLNGYNHEFTVDGDYIWVATFQGVGRINTKSNKVEFYTNQLGIYGTTLSIGHIFVDTDYVWVYITANSYSTGGLAMYDKKLETWKGFGPNDIKDNSFDRFDLESNNAEYVIKSVPGGIQAGFRDGHINGDYDKFVEKKYDYSTRKWEKVSERPFTGEFYESASKYIASNYPILAKNAFRDPEGLTQLKLNKLYQLDGRNSLILSPVIAKKRYLLTSSTVDFLDESRPFPQILVKLGEILSDVQYADPISAQGLVKFLVNQDTMLALVLDSSCGGMGCNDGQKGWLVDLQEKRILKIYTKEQGLPAEELTSELKITKDGDNLVVFDNNNKELFRINTSSYIFTRKKG